MAPREHFAQFREWPPLVAQVLYNRGYRDATAAARFVDNHVGSGNPFSLTGMFEVVTRIRAAIEAGERIVVHGDFDADGVTATALLVETLHALGARVAPYIPDRVDEGYGLNKEALDRMVETGVGLVVTVDCGIRAHEEIAHARALGLDVLVTDHHNLGETLPQANALINPKRPGEGYHYHDFAGVGLAYKLAEALLLAQQRTPVGTPRHNLDPDELLDLVALGTVADMVPLTGENRALVAAGLARMNAAPRPGIAALLARAGVTPGDVDAERISFALAPRINAAGRLDHAIQAYKLLHTRDPRRAKVLADHLEELNSRRRAITDQAVARAEAALDPSAPLLFVAAEDFIEGIVGLVAGKLMERYHRPVVVVRRGEMESRGSARSIAGFHITAALDACQSLLVRHGGHAAAAGFTVETARLPELAARLTELAAATFPTPPPLPPYEADADARLELIDEQIVAALERLAPFGQENPAPRFVLRGLAVRDAKCSRNGHHLVLKLADGRNQIWKAIAFRQGDWLSARQLPTVIDVLAELKREYWRGSAELKLYITDLRPSRANGA